MNTLLIDDKQLKQCPPSGHLLLNKAEADHNIECNELVDDSKEIFTNLRTETNNCRGIGQQKCQNKDELMKKINKDNKNNDDDDDDDGNCPVVNEENKKSEYHHTNDCFLDIQTPALELPSTVMDNNNHLALNKQQQQLHLRLQQSDKQKLLDPQHHQHQHPFKYDKFSASNLINNNKTISVDQSISEKNNDFQCQHDFWLKQQQTTCAVNNVSTALKIIYLLNNSIFRPLDLFIFSLSIVLFF